MTQGFVGDAATKGIGKNRRGTVCLGRGKEDCVGTHTLSDTPLTWMYFTCITLLLLLSLLLSAASLVRGGGHTGGSRAGRRGDAHGRKGGTQHPDRSNLRNLTVSLPISLWPGNTFTRPLSWPHHTARRTYCHKPLGGSGAEI